MISDAQFDQIEQLLEEGHTQRAIARLTGISRGTVHAIATGKRLKQGPGFQPKPCAPHHCPTCGALIDLEPCVACHARGVAAEAGVHHVSEPIEEIMRRIQGPRKSAEGRE